MENERKAIAGFVVALLSLSATALADTPTVSNVVAKQRYPWNGLVDITCTVCGIEGATEELKFAVAALEPESGRTNQLSHLWVMRDGTRSTDLTFSTNGHYRLLWDAHADFGEVNFSNMVVRVNVRDVVTNVHDKVQLWEGGPYWATTNIGAEEPWDYGLYFWWGDTVGYRRENDAWVASDGSSTNFSFEEGNSLTHGKSTSTLQNDGWITSNNVLVPGHDAAHVHWGGSWRLPTKQELSNLKSKCDWTWTTNGVLGCNVCGRGDFASASIFLPTTGIGWDTSLKSTNVTGYFWSSIPNSSNKRFAWDLFISSAGYIFIDEDGYRWAGQAVRPVQGFSGASATAADTGDSAPFPLDTYRGSRLARGTETIAYSTVWNDANSVTISIDGTEVFSAAAPASGDYIWNTEGILDGLHTVTLNDGTETLSFQFAKGVMISDVVAKQRYPWNGKVDITFTETGAVGYAAISVTAEDLENGSNYVAEASALSGDTGMAAGAHHVVWDLNAQGLEIVSTNVVFTVAYCIPQYCVIDLSAGASASSYSVTYLTKPPSGGFNVDEYKTTKLALRLVEPGTFMMCGQYETTLTKPFYCGVFEVTQRQYELVTGSNPSCYKGDMRPVEFVSWNTIRGDSSTYNWPGSSNVDLNSFMGRLRARTGLDFDLPTEAQWEYACHAGTSTDYSNGTNYGGNYSNDPNLNLLGRYSYNRSDGKGGYTDAHTTVGSYLPNAWGLYDMHGNVWEWCLDWYGSLSSPMTDPSGSSSGANRVTRGGSWIYGASSCISSYRSYNFPSYSYDYIGFRLVRPLFD